MVEIFGNKSFDQLKQPDIQRLIDNSQEENIILEFKKELGSNSKEIAKDISGMANAEGGIIIYGINEDDDGKAESFEWLELLDFKEKLENIIATTINPQVSFRIFSIQNEADNTKHVHLVFVPKSSNLHMVIKGNDNRYYKRLGKTIQKMEDSEIKERIKLINANRENLNTVISSLNSEFQELTGTNLNSIKRINYYVIPNDLSDKVETIDNLERSSNLIRDDISEGIYFRAYRGNIANSQYIDTNKWRKATIIHKNGILEFRRSHDFVWGFVSSVEVDRLLKIISFSNEFYRKVNYYGGYKIYLEIGNLGMFRFNGTFDNSQGLHERSIGFLQESIEIESLIVQEPSKNNLKILEIIKTIGGSVGVGGEESYEDIKRNLGILES